MTTDKQVMGNQASPRRWAGLRDIERLDNGISALRCGEERDAIRTPYDVGVCAHAYQRWAGAPVGDVLAYRRLHVYFLVEAGTAADWEAILDSSGARGVPAKPLGAGSIIVLPGLRSSKAARWLRGPGHGPARAMDVLASLRLANQRLICRGQQHVRDQEMAHLAQIAAHIINRLPHLPG